MRSSRPNLWLPSLFGPRARVGGAFHLPAPLGGTPSLVLPTLFNLLAPAQPLGPGAKATHCRAVAPTNPPPANLPGGVYTPPALAPFAPALVLYRRSHSKVLRPCTFRCSAQPGPSAMHLPVFGPTGSFGLSPSGVRPNRVLRPFTLRCSVQPGPSAFHPPVFGPTGSFGHAPWVHPKRSFGLFPCHPCRTPPLVPWTGLEGLLPGAGLLIFLGLRCRSPVLPPWGLLLGRLYSPSRPPWAGPLGPDSSLGPEARFGGTDPWSLGSAFFAPGQNPAHLDPRAIRLIPLPSSGPTFVPWSPVLWGRTSGPRPCFWVTILLLAPPALARGSTPVFPMPLPGL